MATVSGFTINELAGLVGRDRTTVERWLRSGREIRGSKLGGRWRVSLPELAEWLRCRQIQEVRLGTFCGVCGAGLEFDPGRYPHGTDCHGMSCRNERSLPNRLTADDARVLDVVALLYGACREDAAEALLHRWREEAQSEGRPWTFGPTMLGPTWREHAAVAEAMATHTEPDLDNARRDAFDLVARLWDPEDSVFDTFDEGEDISV